MQDVKDIKFSLIDFNQDFGFFEGFAPVKHTLEDVKLALANLNIPHLDRDFDFETWFDKATSAWKFNGACV